MKICDGDAPKKSTPLTFAHLKAGDVYRYIGDGAAMFGGHIRIRLKQYGSDFINGYGSIADACFLTGDRTGQLMESLNAAHVELFPDACIKLGRGITTVGERE